MYKDIDILAVDDDPTNLDIIQEIFSDDYSLETADCGEATLEILGRIRPSVILLDIMMPGIDGYEVCREIRKNPNHNLAKVILVSGKAIPEERLLGYQAGADDYVCKPFYADEFLEKVKVHLKLVDAEKKLFTLNEQLQAQVDAQREKLMQSEKMASLGQLAAGVAHEINNPTGFIMSNLRTLADYVDVLCKAVKLADDISAPIEDNIGHISEVIDKIQELKKSQDINYIIDDASELTHESIDGTQRIKEIVQGLKSFARVDEAEIQEADINEGIEQTLKMVWNEVKYHCEVKKELNPLPKMRCYPRQLNQVVMNLVVNAAHAIPEKGTITIKSELVDSNIVIQISDTGKGIKEENISKLFDPFFTTKPVGQGTGLGLSISYGIVQKHSGDIDVKSKVGEGTTFIITLPLDGVKENEGNNEQAAIC